MYIALWGTALDPHQTHAVGTAVETYKANEEQIAEVVNELHARMKLVDWMQSAHFHWSVWECRCPKRHFLTFAAKSV